MTWRTRLAAWLDPEAAARPHPILCRVMIIADDGYVDSAHAAMALTKYGWVANHRKVEFSVLYGARRFIRFEIHMPDGRTHRGDLTAPLTLIANDQPVFVPGALRLMTLGIDEDVGAATVSRL